MLDCDSKYERVEFSLDCAVFPNFKGCCIVLAKVLAGMRAVIDICDASWLNCILDRKNVSLV